mmetsp:Transcript_13693/g.24039  ORF Transcript_13693/g.24039 Transcript_13693/m.24039 type:complete len:81 (+) Transcript_13693:482-724(+)
MQQQQSRRSGSPSTRWKRLSWNRSFRLLNSCNQHLLIQAANEAAALAATRPQGQAAAPINQSSKDSMPSELHTDCRVMVA